MIYDIEYSCYQQLKKTRTARISLKAIVHELLFLGVEDEKLAFYEYDKEFIGIVKLLVGFLVIDIRAVTVCLWTEIEENEIIGNTSMKIKFGGRK